ncbi:MAG: diacylglycerol/polyprenol kinase family protein [Salinibacter sp.]
MSSSASLPYASEMGRKALHVLALTIPLAMWWLGMPTALYVLALTAFLAVSADIARAYSESFNALIRWIFGSLMRADELPAAGTRVRLNGATCVLVGAALMAVLFPLRLAVPVLTMAMLGDAAAALVGRRLGRHPWGSLSSTVEGTAAFVVTGLAVMACFPAVSLGPALAGVLVGAGGEALPLPVNDNIRVPVVAGIAVAGGQALLSGAPFPLFAGLPP